MKTSFDFNGNLLTLRLEVETKHERAVAELLEAYTIAVVQVERERDYGHYSDAKAKACVIVLRKPDGYSDE